MEPSPASVRTEERRAPSVLLLPWPVPLKRRIDRARETATALVASAIPHRSPESSQAAYGQNATWLLCAHSGRRTLTSFIPESRRVYAETSVLARSANFRSLPRRGGALEGPAR